MRRPVATVALTLGLALSAGALLSGALVPHTDPDAPRVVQFGRTAPCATCWDREAMDAWMRSGQDGAFTFLG